jgi:hypothetical protein
MALSLIINDQEAGSEGCQTGFRSLGCWSVGDDHLVAYRREAFHLEACPDEEVNRQEAFHLGAYRLEAFLNEVADFR